MQKIIETGGGYSRKNRFYRYDSGYKIIQATVQFIRNLYKKHISHNLYKECLNPYKPLCNLMRTSCLPLELSINHFWKIQRQLKVPLTLQFSLPPTELSLNFAYVTGANVHFHIVAAIGPMWAVGTLEGLVGSVGYHVVLEVLTLVAAGETLATNWA